MREFLADRWMNRFAVPTNAFYPLKDAHRILTIK